MRCFVFGHFRCLIPKALLSGSDYVDDPFIPQRGRRLSTGSQHTSNDGFAEKLISIPLRRKRSVKSKMNDDERRMRDLTNLAFPFLHNSEALITDYSDDPFIPQRGRRSTANVDAHHSTNAKAKNPLTNSLRGKRSASDDARLRELTNFAYSLLRKSEPLITDYSDDPFIPQRGRRSTPGTKTKQSPSSRDKRSPNSDAERLRELTNFAYSLLRKSEALINDYSDDPFVPQRGRRPNGFPDTFDTKRTPNAMNKEEQMRQLTNLAYSFLRNSDGLVTDYSDDPFYPQRGRRSSNNEKLLSPFHGKRKANAQSIDNERLRDLQHFAYSLLVNSNAFRPASDYTDDPFIPQRGRRANDKNNISGRSSKLIGKLLPIPLKRKRGAQSTAATAMANLYKNQNLQNSLPAAAAAAIHLLEKRQSITPPPSSLNWCCGDGGHDKTATTITRLQQLLEHYAKQPTPMFIAPHGLAASSLSANSYNDNDNDDEYGLRAGSQASAKRILNAALETIQNQQNNLSQENRDALDLARGSQTPFAIETKM